MLCLFSWIAVDAAAAADDDDDDSNDDDDYRIMMNILCYLS
jgi:hypothetical protein